MDTADTLRDSSPVTSRKSRRPGSHAQQSCAQPCRRRICSQQQALSPAADAGLLGSCPSSPTCEADEFWLQLNDLAVDGAADSIAQNQDVLALALTLRQQRTSTTT
jgi:hypothetical protein